jgi:nucleotide-binding universal stress UspA family protein
MHPIRHVLFASDLTDRSEIALQRAFELCRQAPLTQLTILHVIAANLPATLTDAQRESAAALLGDQVSRSDFPVDRTELAIRIGDAFGTIIGEAFTRAADLIVIGQPGKRRYAEVFMGTTAELVIRFADRPVLMVKQAPQGAYRRVLAAFDGSDGAVRALRTALAIASGAEFRIVHAWWPPRVAFGEMDALREGITQHNAQLRTMVNKLAREAIAASRQGSLKEPSPNVLVDFVEDNPYTALSSQSSWADLLVMGTHSKGRLASTVSIGKLAQHLLVESKCDVITSRP